MTGTIVLSFDEPRHAAGWDLGYSDWMRIDRARIDTFADAIEDHPWIHVDPERAKDTAFGATNARGYPTKSEDEMYVSIAGDPGRPRVSVEEADDCTRLYVDVRGLDESAAGSALREAGLGSSGEPGHLWLDIAALRERARATTAAADWDDRFDAMLAFARSEGWTDETGQHVAAHIVRTTS